MIMKDEVLQLAQSHSKVSWVDQEIYEKEKEVERRRTYKLNEAQLRMHRG